MEAWAYQILQFGKFGSLLLSWGVLFGSAVVGLAFTGHAFKLGRAAYFLTMGLSFLFTGMTSLFVLGLHDAVKNDYLTVIVALIIGSLIPIGIFTGICAAARSRDAFGTRDRWFLSFIPVANLVLLFAPPQEQRKPSPVRTARSIVLVVLGFGLIGAGGGLNRWVEGQANQANETAQNDALLQKKLTRYEVQNFGLEAFLKETVKAVSVPAKLDGITTLKAVEIDKETFRYVYEISDKNANFSRNWQDVMMNRWCKSLDFKFMTDVGATVEGKYVSQEGQQLAELKVNPALCDQWRLQFDKTMQDAANAIKGPTRLDEVTTLNGADYKDGTFTYYYTFATMPSNDGWKAYMKNRWCQADQFKQMMAFDLNIRGVYSTEASAPIGEVLVNSEICGT
ncbi:hypothetical protein [Ensifer sp. 4252]|uniref:hypothetical protein n=1 Tax=Ensifer sp. 4252 TaxID=3373915 RepID=UPI003D1FAEF7